MYFDTVEKQQELYKEINEWVGTPYKHRCMVKGKGTDCILFIAGAFININAIKPNLKYPEYDRDWHMHNSEELLYKYIHKNVNVKDIYDKNKNTGNINNIMNGDICLYKYGKACSHAAVYFDKSMYHSLTGIKVTKSVFLDKMWYRRLTYILRLQK